LEGFVCVVDDSSSAASSMEVTDRIASLEQRVQMQEDEIQLLKSALADVVRRLNISEEQQAMLNRKGPTKGTTQTLRHLIWWKVLEFPDRFVYFSFAFNLSCFARTCSAFSLILWTPCLLVIMVVSKAIGQYLIMIILHPTSPPSPAPALSNLTTSPIVTVQLYLHRPSKRTGPAEPPKSASAVPSQSTNTPSEAKVLSDRAARLGSRKVPPFTLPLRKCTSQLVHSPLDMPSYRNEGYVKMYLKGRPITMYMPKDLVDTYCLEAKADLPPKKLKLDWVYGYRGRDCRSNLYLLPTGETVYFIASVVVLYNVDEQLQRHYTGHTDDIKCLAVHPDKITIATGQVAGTSSDGKLLAPHVRVWDSVSLNTLHILGTGFFDRALVCLSFSKSNGGSWLCVVDDSNDHILSVWDWQREERLAEVKCSNESVFVADFHPTDANIMVSCGKSHLYFWSLEKGTLVKKQGLFEKQEKPKFVLCVTFSENGEAITGDSSGNILVWGKGKRIKGSNRISLAIQGAHEASVFALCMLRNGTLVSGGKDRKLISWDENYHKIQTVPELYGPIRTVAEGRGETVLIGTTKNYVLQGNLDGEFIPITQSHTDELWGLTVHPLKHQFLTCGHDKHVCLWDSASHQPIWTKTLEDAAQSAGFHPSGATVAIGTQTGRWLVLDTESKDLVTVHTDGNEQLSVMRFSPDGHFLVIGSHDNYIYIYAVAENGKKYSRVGKCSGHSSFITHLDWSVDSQYLVSNSGDYEILYWIPSVCKQVVSVETTRDIEWASFTCTLGFHVFGLWPDGSDGTDINAVCSSNAKRLLVTGDDFGKVHLFSFPCSQSRAPSHIYCGHSSHVTNVNFLHDDSHLQKVQTIKC
uniref:HELP domain-containing protein n=1 Tax=Sinocyclocheilus grahami TaxID=75366 RepID=A0A672RIP3_SINGR